MIDEKVYKSDVADLLRDYQKLLESKMPTLPPRLVQLSSSELFSDNGFPAANVSNENLGKFLDSQQENRGLAYANLIGHVDKSEIKILTNGIDILEKANEQATVGKGGLSALLHGFFVAREIHAFAHGRLPSPKLGKRLRFIEIGPGSGWTTFFLLQMGIDVTCVEVSPNFIATQEFLFKSAKRSATGEFSRLHWWDFYDHTQQQKKAFDGLIMNHMFCEITTWARKYIAKWITENLYDHGKIFLQAWGDERFCYRDEALNELSAKHLYLLNVRSPFEIGEFYVLTKRKEERQRCKLATMTKMLHLKRLSHTLRAQRSHWPIHNKATDTHVKEFIYSLGYADSVLYEPLFIYSGIEH